MVAHLSDLLERAEAAAALVGRDPARAYRLAADVAVEARAARAWDAAAVALRAAARAASWQGEHTEASRRIREAMAAARRPAGSARLVEVQTTAAHLWFLQGSRSRALRVLDDAGRSARGDQRLKVAAQRAVLLWHMGRHGEAAGLLQQVRDGAGGELRADALVNLGGVLGEQARYDEAEAALRDAARAYEDLELHHDAAAVALHNLAHLYALAGRIPASLEVFDDVERRLDTLGAPVAWLLVGRAQVLLAANLVGEALEAAERATAGLDRRAPLDLRAEAWWRLASARHRQGDAAGAASAAANAARLFQRLRSAPRAAMARRLEVRSMVLVGGPTPVLLARARAIAAELAASGLAADAVEAGVEAIELAAALGRVDAAATERVNVRAGRGRGPALLRARAWYGEAVALAALGDVPKARQALDRGLRLLDDHRASLGSTELRAQASGHGAELAELGVRLAVERGRPADLLRWAERWRAGALWRRPVVPGELAAELAALRWARAERAEADAAGRDVAALLRRESELEATVRRITRQAAGAEGGAPRVVGGVAALDLGCLRAALGGRALVEVVQQGGQLHAVVVAAERCTLHRLGEAALATAEVAALGFALRRLGRPGRQAALDASRASAEHALAELDAMLLGPLARRLGVRDVVVVPTAALHGVPWPSLPTLAGRAVTVVPSSAWWAAGCQAATGSGGTAEKPVRGAGDTVLVAGPGLPGAEKEVRALARRYAGATVLTGSAATATATAKALDGAALAHLACHGRFRADNPLFSSLELADGPLTVYDLESLGGAPQHVVLSACDSGVSATRPGDELLGVLSSLFALGTRLVVASVVPVPDLDTGALMVAFHDALLAGQPPPAALAWAAAAVDPSTPGGFVTRTAFVCFGD